MAIYWKMCYLVLIIFKINQAYYTKAADDNIPITLVTDAVQKRAVCMDGSAAGYHYDSGCGEGADSWLIFLMGGAWCGTGQWCNERIHSDVGSTINVTTQNFQGILSSNQTVNPDFFNWNRIFVRYCDSSSFIGDTQVTANGTTFQLRGSMIFDAVIKELLAKGMRTANNVILTGVSAGGLGVILHCDSFRAQLPNVDRVKCISDSGYFIHAPNVSNAKFRYGIFAQTIKFHNLTSFLPKACTSRMDPSLCLFPQYLVGDNKTPIFLLNSIFDSAQIVAEVVPDNPPDIPGWNICIRNLNKCTLAQKQLIKEFGHAFLQEFNDIGNNTSRGIFVNACYFHVFTQFDSLWNSNGSPRLENKTISQSIGDWYFDRSSVQVIDTTSNFPIDCTGV